MPQKDQAMLERQRLIQASHRLAKISWENPLKLFRLLYMLDLKLFKKTGKSCTGEIYYALADGPAPGTLRSLLVMREIKFDQALGKLTKADPKAPFDGKLFCPQGLAILEELEKNCGKLPVHELKLDDGNAWWRVYTDHRGVGATIPFDLALEASLGGGGQGKLDKNPVLARGLGLLEVGLSDFLAKPELAVGFG